MRIRSLLAALALACGGIPAPALAQDAGQVNVICSVQAEWCNMIQTVFARTTGIKVNMSLRARARRWRSWSPSAPTRRPTSGSAAPATRTCRPPSRA